MRALFKASLIGGGLLAASIAMAQRPGGGGGASLSKDADTADLVTRMMAFDANKDGTLSRSEVTDERLQRLFDRADADKDGSVTKSELVALAAKEHIDDRGGPGGFGGLGGPPGSFGGPGGPGGMRPGEILPAMLRQRLDLTAAQAKQVDALQKEVDTKLATILNAAQRTQLAEIRSRGPGRFGPPGGPGGPPPGGFGGPPPGGPGGPPPRDQ